ncbi:hypothetical protein B0O99DRAFT_681757 [Bisporella sp. PMI_857]|nr:hypothetical protein B0O99DRAFT_681757 [Bisporella sp. PMI_857]
MSRFSYPAQGAVRVVEVFITVTTLALFCCAFPDRFRTKLWEAGGEKGWNSNPNLRIYFYANYKEPPPVPLIWSQSLTTSNLSVALLAASLCLTRIVLDEFEYDGTITFMLNDMLLSSFWMYSVSAQSSADLTDPTHLSQRPWYLEKSCDAVSSRYLQACMIAKIS